MGQCERPTGVTRLETGPKGGLWVVKNEHLMYMDQWLQLNYTVFYIEAEKNDEHVFDKWSRLDAVQTFIRTHRDMCELKYVKLGSGKKA